MKMRTPQPVILVAEDDPSDEHLLKWAFTNAGLTRPLQFVHNGAEAMDYLLGVSPFDDRARYPFPDLLVLDWRMPRVDGCELLSWLRKIPDLDQLRVAVMSGASWEQDFEQARSMGANLFLNKWKEFSELVQAIKDLIGGAGLEVANSHVAEPVNDDANNFAASRRPKLT